MGIFVNAPLGFRDVDKAQHLDGAGFGGGVIETLVQT
jgi:hypothetical protein